MIRRLLALVGLLTASGLGAQGWRGDQTSLPVPPTEQARQSDFSWGLLAKTPVERLKALETTEASRVKISVQLAKKGVGENQLWELRWEPGAAWGPGTWVAFRDGLGRLREVRVILLEGTDGADHRVSQPGTWIRLVPGAQGNKCRLDLFLAGRLVTGGWAVPASLLDVMRSSDSWLWETTSTDLDWGSLLPQRRWEDETVEALQVRMHKLLSTVPEARTTLWWPGPSSSLSGTAQNGAPWGAWVFLPGQPGTATRGLGAWGVTLWTATGVLRGWKGDFPTWKSLLESRIELPGYSQALVPDDITADPAFAIDWIRNLALAVYQLRFPSRPKADDSADAKGLPFLAMVPGAGYAAEDLPALIHLLAVTRPGQAYLATLSAQQADRAGTAAVTFREPAVLLPWIGLDQRVRVSVYAGPRETTLSDWLSKVPQNHLGLRPDHITLVELPLPPTVELPVLPAR